MIWTILFSLSIAQGIFLLSVILVRPSQNKLASLCLGAVIALMVISNFGYLVARTDLVNYIPQMFGVPFGMIFLFGPILYGYSRSLVDPAFRWRSRLLPHFIPYAIQLLINIPFLTTGKHEWILFIEHFLSGELSVRSVEKVMLLLQDIHLSVYLMLTFRLIASAKREEARQYVIPFAERIRWLTILNWCFFVFLVCVFSMGLFVVTTERYIPVTNYIYTILSSGIIYLIAYRTVLNPEIVSPDFVQKYKAYMQFTGIQGEQYFQKVKSLLSDAKVFVNPELTLQSIADSVGLPAHQVSKLINEKFGKSFNDLINEYRVNEFIARVNDPQYKAYSVLGVAMDVGFSSKSAFNSTFKKMTGKTPKEFRRG